MATAIRTGALTTLQNNVSTAVNGIVLDIGNAIEVTVEVSGTFTGITANFECSVDGGITWHPASLIQMSSIPGITRVITAGTTGIYHLENAQGLNRFRARTTIATPTGGMTVKAISSTW